MEEGNGISYILKVLFDDQKAIKKAKSVIRMLSIEFNDFAYEYGEYKNISFDDNKLELCVSSSTDISSIEECAPNKLLDRIGRALAYKIDSKFYVTFDYEDKNSNQAGTMGFYYMNGNRSALVHRKAGEPELDFEQIERDSTPVESKIPGVYELPALIPLEGDSIDNYELTKNFSQIEDHLSDIEIANKTFVFTGITHAYDGLFSSITDYIVELGGIKRTSVSGKTDYLVVIPQTAGFSKINGAKEQKMKGSAIKVIGYTQLLNLLIKKTNK